MPRNNVGVNPPPKGPPPPPPPAPPKPPKQYDDVMDELIEIRRKTSARLSWHFANELKNGRSIDCCYARLD